MRKERLHAWVLLKRPKREIEESFFIEPTTGRKYTKENAPYFAIEGIFNNVNFWINLDASRPVNELNLDDFSDDTTGDWEYVMLLPKEKKGEGEGEDENGEGNEEEEEEEGEEDFQEDLLDMPPPWSPKLQINKDKFIDLIPNGEKTVFYKKVKVDLYADCAQIDGLVKRVTMFNDFKRCSINEIRSSYKNRVDQLCLRRRFPFQFKTIEHFNSSIKANHWKKMITIDKRWRKIYFYHHRNADGLIYREEQILRKIINRYKNRQDKLIYRSVTYDPNAHPTNNPPMVKDLHT